MKRKLHRVTFLQLVVVGSLLSACGSGSSDVARQSTVEAISASFRGTATAAGGANLDSSAAVETAQAEATSQSQLAAGTQAAQAALGADAQTATAAAYAPILAELPRSWVDRKSTRLNSSHSQ